MEIPTPARTTTHAAPTRVRFRNHRRLFGAVGPVPVFAANGRSSPSNRRTVSRKQCSNAPRGAGSSHWVTGGPWSWLGGPSDLESRAKEAGAMRNFFDSRPRRVDH
jgi:hypothetical protein